MLLGYSDAEERKKLIKQRKKRPDVNVMGGGGHNSLQTISADEPDRFQVGAISNGKVGYEAVGPLARYGKETKDSNELTGVEALLRATAAADRSTPKLSPLMSNSRSGKGRKSPVRQNQDTQRAAGPGMWNSRDSPRIPTLSSIDPASNSLTTTVAHLAVSVEQLQTRVTELEAAQFRAREKTTW